MFPKQAPAPPGEDALSTHASRALSGDLRSERELLERLLPPLRRVVRFASPSREDAEDALQESVLEILAALPKFRGESTLLRFATRIARRATLARSRATQRQGERLAGMSELAFPLANSPPTPGEDAVVFRRRAELVRLVARLPERQAEALALRVLLGFSLKETSLAAGVPVNTIRTRMRLALKCLRSWIGADATIAELLTGSTG